MNNNRRIFESALKPRVEKRLKEKIAEYVDEKEKTPFNPSASNATTTLNNNTNIMLSHRLPMTNQ